MYDRDPGQQEAQLVRTYALAQERLAAMEAQRDELNEAIADLTAQMAWGQEMLATLRKGRS